MEPKKCRRDDGSDKWTRVALLERVVREVMPPVKKAPKWPKPGPSTRTIQDQAMGKLIKKYGSWKAAAEQLMAKEREKEARQKAKRSKLKMRLHAASEWYQKRENERKLANVLAGEKLYV